MTYEEKQSILESLPAPVRGTCDWRRDVSRLHKAMHRHFLVEVPNGAIYRGLPEGVPACRRIASMEPTAVPSVLVFEEDVTDAEYSFRRSGERLPFGEYCGAEA